MPATKRSTGWACPGRGSTALRRAPTAAGRHPPTRPRSDASTSASCCGTCATPARGPGPASPRRPGSTRRRCRASSPSSPTAARLRRRRRPGRPVGRPGPDRPPRRPQRLRHRRRAQRRLRGHAGARPARRGAVRAPGGPRRPGAGPGATLDEVAGLVAEAFDAAPARGADPVGITVAVPGLVRSVDGVATYAPNIGWHDVPVLEGLRARVGLDCPIRVENDANLSAIAEWAMGAEARTPTSSSSPARSASAAASSWPAGCCAAPGACRGRSATSRWAIPTSSAAAAAAVAGRRWSGWRAAAGRRRRRRPGARPRPRPGDPARRGGRPRRRRR